MISEHKVTKRATRKGGKDDECFYCKSKIGDFHKKDCVLIHKKVISAFLIQIRIEEEVPNFWDAELIEFKGNGSSSCASNYIPTIVEKLEEIKEAGECFCDNVLKKKYIETVIEDYLDEE